MTDQEARKNWDSIRLRFEHRLTLNPWESFCVKFAEALRHVKNQGEWEGRELILQQLQNDIRAKLILEVDKRSRQRVAISGLGKMHIGDFYDFFRRMTGLTLSKARESKTGFEAQVADESDMMQIMSYSGRRLTTGSTLEIQPVR
jgi:hypothetical protein